MSTATLAFVLLGFAGTVNGLVTRHVHAFSFGVCGMIINFLSDGKGVTPAVYVWIAYGVAWMAWDTVKMIRKAVRARSEHSSQDAGHDSTDDHASA